MNTLPNAAPCDLPTTALIAGLRIGQGFDLHRLVPERPFVLGGLTLPWEKGPEGHSDGDVLLHALTDALLGATGQGDIGTWFPPSDPQWKGADSRQLLEQVWLPLCQSGWRVLNVDCTVFLEQPKLGPHKPALEAALAGYLQVEPSQVCIKAKTMEGLGAIGEQHALAASVTVLLFLQTPT